MKMVSFFVIFIISFSSFADPIEGGKTISVTDMKYIDFIQIETPIQGHCSATQIAYNKILTAAHCIVDLHSENFTQVFKEGSYLGINGRVKSIHIPPQFLAYAKKYKAEPHKSDKKPIYLRNRALFDYTVIITTKSKTKRTLPYPTIISDESDFDTRSKMEVIGFGDTTMSWNGKRFQSQGASSSGIKGENEWASCQINYEGIADKNLDELGLDVFNILNIKSKTIHSISNNIEQQKQNSSMILRGDSGAASIEYDKNNKMIITGVASYIQPYGDGSGTPRLMITLPSGEQKSIELSSMPDDWGNKNKNDLSFQEIKTELQQLGLLTDDKMKDGVKVTREYTRVTNGYFADLLHPTNQSFIKEVLEKE